MGCEQEHPLSLIRNCLQSHKGTSYFSQAKLLLYLVLLAKTHSSACCACRSKVDAEQLVRQRWPRHAILRSSIIYGPPPPHPVRRGLFLQFIDGALASKVSQE